MAIRRCFGISCKTTTAWPCSSSAFCSIFTVASNNGLWSTHLSCDGARKRIRWQKAFLPAMYTDVVLRGANRCVILDAKYYRESFQSRFGRDKIRSEHLYQILSYLQNFGTPAGATMEGMLLYPTVHQDFDLQYVILGFPVRVCSIDLDQPWTAIRDRLLAIVGPTSVAE